MSGRSIKVLVPGGARLRQVNILSASWWKLLQVEGSVLPGIIMYCRLWSRVSWYADVPDDVWMKLFKPPWLKAIKAQGPHSLCAKTRISAHDFPEPELPTWSQNLMEMTLWGEKFCKFFSVFVRNDDSLEFYSSRKIWLTVTVKRVASLWTHSRQKFWIHWPRVPISWGCND